MSSLSDLLTGVREKYSMLFVGYVPDNHLCEYRDKIAEQKDYLITHKDKFENFINDEKTNENEKKVAQKTLDLINVALNKLARYEETIENRTCTIMGGRRRRTTRRSSRVRRSRTRARRSRTRARRSRTRARH